MDLSTIDGELASGFGRADAETEEILSTLPRVYRSLLEEANGIVFASGAILYAAEDLEERAETHETERYVPGHVVIGSDGGEYLFLLRQAETSPVLLAGAGSLGSAPMEELAADLGAWVAEGCPTEPPSEAKDGETPWSADVYLDALPGGKLSGLVAVKKALGLDLSIAELKGLAEELPACLLSGAPYGKFRQRCDSINERLGPCVSLRS